MCFIVPVSRVIRFRDLSRLCKRMTSQIVENGRSHYPSKSSFIGHFYIEHAGGERQGKHCLVYHRYLIPEEVELKNAIVFAYINGLRIALKG